MTGPITAERRRLPDEALSRIAGGAYCFVEPDGAGFDMRDMAVELIERRALAARTPDAATVERLTAALEQIAAGTVGYLENGDQRATHLPGNYVQQIARAALSSATSARGE